jgi:glycerol-3-phosphate dehydrogenase
MNERSGTKTRHRHVFSKGIHLIVDRLTPNQRVLTFFADDGRLFFVIPMGPRTCIGTTDTRVDARRTQVTDEDRRFVLDNINKRLRLEQAAHRGRRHRRALRRATARRRRQGLGGRRNDWMQLSRKHAVEVDEARKHVSIFGGKLTDCLNVGEELAEAVTKLGVELRYPRARWYGEPPAETREEFMHQAGLMELDALTSKASPEPLSQRLWRRYGSGAFAMLEAIRADPREAELLIEGAEYIRCEIEHAARREMVVKLDDFLRRRSKIALVVRRDELRDAPGLREACRILFGDEADARYDEYFSELAQGEGGTLGEPLSRRSDALEASSAA